MSPFTARDGAPRAAVPTRDGADGRAGSDGPLRRAWQAQRALEALAGRWRPGLEAADRARLTRELVLELGLAGADLVRELERTDVDGATAPLPSNVRLGLADLTATLLSLLATWDVEPDALLGEYWRVHRVRAQRCREAALTLPPDARVVGVDIDGVLADYVGGFVEFLNAELGSRYAPEQVDRPGVGRSLAVPPARYRALKRRFRESGLEGAGCAPVPGAVEFVRHLARRAYYICLLTGRPGETFRRLVPDTLEWLERHGVPFHYCLFDSRKPDRLVRLVERAQLVAFVEDSPDQALRIAELGVPVWLRRTPYSGGVRHPHVRYFDDFHALRAEF